MGEPSYGSARGRWFGRGGRWGHAQAPDPGALGACRGREAPWCALPPMLLLLVGGADQDLVDGHMLRCGRCIEDRARDVVRLQLAHRRGARVDAVPRRLLRDV